MHTKEAIRYALGMSDGAIRMTLADIDEEPMRFPTANGGCHPLWVMGHLAVVEGMTHQILEIGPNPVADWAEFFGPGTTPSADNAGYPAYAEVKARYEAL